MSADSMGIHPTSHTPKTDSSAEKIPTLTEVGWYEKRLLGGGRDESENMIHEELTGRKITGGG